MQLKREVEQINTSLIDLFGIDTISGQAMWRVSYSEDEFEWRYGTYDDITPSGVYLRTVTETRYVPKYKQWIHDKYILERLVVVPIINEKDLPENKVSYEPMHVFEDGKGNALPPKIEICKFIIDLVYATQFGDHSVARYKDPREDPEYQSKKVDELVEQLWGDESDLKLTTITGESIIVPRNYEKKES